MWDVTDTFQDQFIEGATRSLLGRVARGEIDECTFLGRDQVNGVNLPKLVEMTSGIERERERERDEGRGSSSIIYSHTSKNTK